MIAILNEAKKHLDVTGNDEDADIDRLIQVATAYLTRIGVETAEPVAEPVKQAALLIVAQLYRNGRDYTLRSQEVSGVGKTDYHSPTVITEATDRLVKLLIAPYREVQI